MTAGRLWIVTALVALALVCSLVLAAAQLVRHSLGQTTVLPEPLPPLAAAPQHSALRETGAIIALAPFGQKPALASEGAAPAPRRPDMALRGVLLDPDPQSSRAFVAINGKISVFQQGDLVGTAELAAINTDTVTLKSGGGVMIVGFDGVAGEPSRETPRAVVAAQADPADPFARLAAAIVPGQGSIDLRAAPPPETTEQYIDFWRDRITQNPQAAMDRVGVELVENGYRIKPEPNIGVRLAGLRPGDVVTRLNGRTLGDLDSDRVLYDDVAAAGIARVEVERDGRSLLLTFPLR